MTKYERHDPQEPTIEVKKGPGNADEAVEQHPAYAQIGANRVSGGAYLYGSDFKHQHYITIQIHDSELHRQLSGDRAHSKRRLIEIAMSEAQWATFVSSLNQGGGVQCTLEFTPEGGRIWVRMSPEDTDRFRIEVQDTGIGMTQEDQGRLFKEFSQLDQSASKEHGGTGLGLALVKQIVEAQGGEVGVRSEPGKGSLFYAILPRVLKAGEPDGESPSESSSGLG